MHPSNPLPTDPLPVSISVLTFRRPEGLRRTLDGLLALVSDSPEWRIAEILVIDNDPDRSGRSSVEDAGGDERVRYVSEPRPGVSAARNRALDEAVGRILVFIDDDETPADGWPGGLIEEMRRSRCALVGGPVRSEFEEPPPDWVISGRFFERAEPPTGTRQSWLRSGNLAIDLTPVRAAGIRFDEAFGQSGSEDVAFSTAADRAGLGLSWTNDAAVIEWVSSDRVTATWLVERARKATAGYVRATAGDGQPIKRLTRGGATIMMRAIQGSALVVGGFVLRRRHTMIKGAVLLSRSRGTMEGLWGRRHVSYGASAAEKRWTRPDRSQLT